MNNAPVDKALGKWGLDIGTADISITKLLNILLGTMSFEDLYNILDFNNYSDELDFLTKGLEVIKNKPELYKEMEERKFKIEGSILETV